MHVQVQRIAQIAHSDSGPGTRRWLRRILYLGAGLLIVAAGVWAWRAINAEWAARRAAADLVAALANVDAAEPHGWHWEDLEKQRAKVANAENSSKLVLQAAKELPDLWSNDPIFFELRELAPPARLTEEQTAALGKAIDRLQPVLIHGRGLANHSRGRFPAIALANDVFSTPVPHLEGVRSVGDVLYWDALWQCQRAEYARAWKSATAALNTARSIGDEPFITSQAVRISVRDKAVAAMERIVGHTALEADALSKMADLLKDEMEENLQVHAIRGERAAQHQFYSALASGELDLRDAAKWGPEEATWDQMDALTRRTIIAGSHAYMLRSLSQGLVHAKAEEPQRGLSFQQWDFAAKEDRGRNRVPPLAAVLTPWLTKLAATQQRSTTRLQCALVAMAAERFRMMESRWPQDTAELVAVGLLPRIPIDPSDGMPLRLRHAPDGMVVYSVLRYKDYEGTAWDDLAVPPAWDFVRVEFRLWNPDRRSQPPVLPRSPDTADADPAG